MEENLELFLETFIPDKPSDGKVIPFLHDYDDMLHQNSEEDGEYMRFLWQRFGLTSFNRGKLWLINPNEYAELVRGFKDVSEEAIPLFRTALGAFIVWDLMDDVYQLCYLDVSYNEFNPREEEMSYFFDSILVSDDCWDNDFNGEMENIAIEKFPDLKEDECVGFVKPLVSGGEERSDNMRKVNLKDYLKTLLEIHDKNKS